MSHLFSVDVMGPPGTSQTLEVRGQELRVGRDESCDVILPSPAVSRVHVRVVPCENGLRVWDESSNGTWLGSGRLCQSSSTVAPDEEIGVGPYRLRFRVGTGSEVTPEVRRRIHRAVLDHLDLASLDDARMDESVLRPKVVEALRRIINRLELSDCAPSERPRLIQEMTDEVLGLGPIQGLLDDSTVSEIMVVDSNTIYVERNGRIESTAYRFMDDEACRAAIERIVTPLGRRIDESTPLVDARLRDGSRVNAIIPPLATRGPCITIRKFARAPMSMEDLIHVGSLTEDMATFLLRCVKARKNLIVSGGTGSGKTTLLNVLSREIPSHERIVTIEDAAELRLHQPHVVSLEARPCNLEGRGEYTIRQLLKNALRMRPDRIVVGECRSGEAIDMLQAMNTGHEGSMTTTHANSPREALKRIEMLCMMAGLDVSIRSIREQVAASVHVVIQQLRFADGSRRITAITEVGGLTDAGEVRLHDIFAFHREATGPQGEPLGEHRPSGIVPSFLDQFVRQGLIEDGRFV